jgi:hypothetical protein
MKIKLAYVHTRRAYVIGRAEVNTYPLEMYSFLICHRLLSFLLFKSYKANGILTANYELVYVERSTSGLLMALY